MALFGIQIHYSVSLTFLSDAPVVWGAHLTRQIPAEELIPHMDMAPGMMEIHPAGWGSVDCPSVGLREFLFRLVSFSVHHWVTWKWVAKY